MPGPKTKSKLTLSLPEAIINLKNDNTKPYKIADCLSSVFSRTIKSKYVSMVIYKHNKRNGNGNGTVRFSTVRYGDGNASKSQLSL